MRDPSKPPIGEVLVSRGDLSREQLDRAVGLQRSFRGRLGRLLIALGFVTRAQVATALGEQYQRHLDKSPRPRDRV